MVFQIGAHDPDPPITERRHFAPADDTVHNVLTGVGPMAPESGDPHRKRWKEGWNHKRHHSAIQQDKTRKEEDRRRETKMEAFTEARRDRLDYWNRYNRFDPVTGAAFDPATRRSDLHDDPWRTFPSSKLAVPDRPVMDHLGARVAPAAQDPARETRREMRREVLRENGLVAPRHAQRETAAGALSSGFWPAPPMPRLVRVQPPKLDGP